MSLYIRSINGVFHIEEIRRLQRELQNALEPEYGDIDIDLIPEIDPDVEADAEPEIDAGAETEIDAGTGADRNDNTGYPADADPRIGH